MFFIMPLSVSWMHLCEVFNKFTGDELNAMASIYYSAAVEYGKGTSKLTNYSEVRDYVTNKTNFGDRIIEMHTTKNWYISIDFHQHLETIEHAWGVLPLIYIDVCNFCGCMGLDPRQLSPRTLTTGGMLVHVTSD